MLQTQRRLAAQSVASPPRPPALPNGNASTAALVAIERAVDAAWADYQRALDEGCRAGTMTRALARLDRMLRGRPPDHDEYMDQDLGEERRVRALTGLDRINDRTRVYPPSLDAILPAVEAVAARREGPVRVLELASGHGELLIRLGREAAKRGIAVELVGSDIRPELVALARKRAAGTGVKAEFAVRDATDLAAVPSHDFDVVTTMYSLHHFSPGKAGCALFEAYRVSRHAVVAIDVPRGARRVLKFLAGAFYYSGNTDLAHDSAISAAKAYAPEELDLIARIATPEAVRTHARVTKDLQSLTLIHPTPPR